MVERLEEMRKGRRERIENGSREKIEKREETKKLNFFFFLNSALRCSHGFFKSSGYDKLELKHQNVVFTSLEFIRRERRRGMREDCEREQIEVERKGN